MVEELKHIMAELDVKDWISIASIVASLITATCTALFFYKRQSIINKFDRELESHKAKLAKDISRSSTTLEERIIVMKEVLRSIAKLNQNVNRLRSFNFYECKNKRQTLLIIQNWMNSILNSAIIMICSKIGLISIKGKQIL